MTKTTAKPNSSKYALTIQYCGRDYFGFQSQRKGKEYRTIQEELEKALHTALREQAKVYPAGRTDQGVHALGQVVHFRSSNDNIDMNEFIYSLNALLPKDISVIHGSGVPLDFHARFSCIGREYLYQVVNTSYRPALYKNYYWIRDSLSTTRIREAASYVIGELDFASFTKTSFLESGESTIRRIDSIELIEKPPCFFFIIRAQDFYTT